MQRCFSNSTVLLLHKKNEVSLPSPVGLPPPCVCQESLPAVRSNLVTSSRAIYSGRPTSLSRSFPTPSYATVPPLFDSTPTTPGALPVLPDSSVAPCSLRSCIAPSVLRPRLAEPRPTDRRCRPAQTSPVGVPYGPSARGCRSPCRIAPLSPFALAFAAAAASALPPPSRAAVALSLPPLAVAVPSPSGGSPPPPSPSRRSRPARPKSQRNSPRRPPRVADGLSPQRRLPATFGAPSGGYAAAWTRSASRDSDGAPAAPSSSRYSYRPTVHVESDFTVPAAPLARPLSASYIDDNQN